LRQWKSEGIDCIDVYAPEEGANSYGGLDAKDRFALDPGVGSVDDFRRLVKQAHAMRMSVITSQNLGYAAIEAPQFIKAEHDVRAGLASRESQFFFWSKNAEAPPPATGNSYFLIRPSLPGYDVHKNEFWQWSEDAGQRPRTFRNTTGWIQHGRRKHRRWLISGWAPAWMEWLWMRSTGISAMTGKGAPL
jgi:glycosidase